VSPEETLLEPQSRAAYAVLLRTKCIGQTAIEPITSHIKLYQYAEDVVMPLEDIKKLRYRK